jgi:Rrf2 family protein
VKLSTRGRYGVRALLELATGYKGGPIPINKLAERQEISAKYLEQLLIPLKAAGLVSSVRGARGGYVLARDPAQVSLYDIVSVLEGPVVVVDCVENPDFCDRVGGCVVHLLWDEMSSLMRNFLVGITLANLVERSKLLDCDYKSQRTETAG